MALDPGKLVAIKDAVWALLDENEDLTAFFSEHGGRKYSYDAGDKLPVDLPKASLPALILLPETTTEDIELSGHTSDTIQFAIQMHVQDRDVDTLLTFIWYVGRAIKSAYQGSNVNLGLSYVGGVYLDKAVKIERHEDPRDIWFGRLWSAERSVQVKFIDTFSA